MRHSDANCEGQWTLGFLVCLHQVDANKGRTQGDYTQMHLDGWEFIIILGGKRPVSVVCLSPNEIKNGQLLNKWTGTKKKKKKDQNSIYVYNDHITLSSGFKVWCWRVTSGFTWMETAWFFFPTVTVFTYKCRTSVFSKSKTVLMRMRRITCSGLQEPSVTTSWGGSTRGSTQQPRSPGSPSVVLLRYSQEGLWAVGRAASFYSHAK